MARDVRRGKRRWRCCAIATGRPGPSTWELGTYPARPGRLSGARRELVRGRRLREVRRQERCPPFTTGAGRQDFGIFLGHPDVQQLQRQRDPSQLATYRGSASSAPTTWPATSRSGAANAVGDKRYILGGAWNEPIYQVPRAGCAARRSTDRTNNGIRCIIVGRRARLSTPALDEPDLERRCATTHVKSLFTRRRVPDLPGPLRLRPDRSQGRRRVHRRQLGVLDAWNASRMPPRMATSVSSRISSSRRMRSRRIRRLSTFPHSGGDVPSVVPAIGDELPRVSSSRADARCSFRCTRAPTNGVWNVHRIGPNARRDLLHPADEGPPAIGGLRRNAIRPRSPASSRSSA